MLKCTHHAAFQDDLLQSSLFATPNESLTTFLGQYSTDLSLLLDKHAPLQERLLLVRPRAPWFTSEISEAKKLCRRYEDMWRTSGLAVHLEMFQTQRRVVLNLIRTARRKHFSAKINENATNPKALFTVLDHLLHRKKELNLPNHQHPSELAESLQCLLPVKDSQDSRSS